MQNTQDKTKAFLEELYKMAEETPRAAMSAVYEKVNGLLLRSEIEECKLLLREVDIKRLPLNVAYGFATFSFMARYELQPEHPQLVSRLNKRLAEIEKRLEAYENRERERVIEEERRTGMYF